MRFLPTALHFYPRRLFPVVIQYGWCTKLNEPAGRILYLTHGGLAMRCARPMPCDTHSTYSSSSKFSLFHPARTFIPAFPTNTPQWIPLGSPLGIPLVGLKLTRTQCKQVSHSTHSRQRYLQCVACRCITLRSGWFCTQHLVFVCRGSVGQGAPARQHALPAEQRVQPGPYRRQAHILQLQAQRLLQHLPAALLPGPGEQGDVGRGAG